MDEKKIMRMHKYDNDLDDLLDEIIDDDITPDDFVEYYGVEGTKLEKRIREKFATHME